VPEIVDAMKHRRGEPAGSFANVIEIPQHVQRKISNLAQKLL
jgi:hypothetical protein